MVEISFGFVGSALLEEQLAVSGKGFLDDDAGISVGVFEDVKVNLLPFLVALKVGASAEKVESDSDSLELVVADSLFEAEFEEKRAFVDSL